MKLNFKLWAMFPLLATLLLGAMSSCTETSESIDETDPPTITLSTSAITFNAEGTATDSSGGVVEVTTNRDWSVSCNIDSSVLSSWGWSVSPSLGSNDGSFTISAASSDEAHSATFKVSIYKESGVEIYKEIAVSQEGPYLVISVDDEAPKYTGGTLALSIESSSSWSASFDDDSWIHLAQTSGDASGSSATTIDIDVDPNSGDEREATLTVTNGNSLTKTVKITQGKYYTEIAQVTGIDENMTGYGLIKEDLSILSSDDWTISSSESWITFSSESGEACPEDPTVIQMSSEINFYSARTAVITFTSGTTTTTYNISQPTYTNPTTTYRVGDPGIQFDESQFDPSYKYYDKMMIWKTAGTENGIPYLADQLAKVTKTFEPGTTSTELAAYFYDNRTASELIVLLKNGDYTFDCSVRLYSNAVLIGESRDGVKITVDPSIGTSTPITLYAASNAGVRNLWLHGGWLNEDGNNYPKYSYREATVYTELEDLDSHVMINVKSSGDDNISNCYLDNVKITNSASHPIWLRGKHITVRDLDIDGAFNKAGSCQGYMYLGASLSLITGCKVTGLRHISMQGSAVTQNVFYDNDLVQEFSFHSSDGGDNLISHNRIYLSPDLFEGYNAVMGPWSSAHSVGGLNFVYGNRCKEDNGNRGGNTPWSDEQLYLGPYVVSVGSDNPTRYTNFSPVDEADFPPGGSLYPVILD